jgi:serine/threonine protein kinase
MPPTTQVQQHRAVREPLEQERAVGNWRLVRLLGEGSWSQVYQAAPAPCTLSTADYVLKITRPEFAADPLANDMLRREAQIGTTVEHPNLVSVLAARLDEPPSYIVMPYMIGVSLLEMLQTVGSLRTPHALWIARQVASGLKQLHRTQWLHGDIKPANIFVATSGHATLIDFGMARRLPLSPSGNHHFAGTPDFAAPEWLSASCTPGPCSDVYSLGLTLQQMLTGAEPETRSRGKQPSSYRSQMPEAQTGASCLPSNVARLLERVLNSDPARRPTLDELIRIFVELEIETLSERLEAGFSETRESNPATSLERI